MSKVNEEFICIVCPQGCLIKVTGEFGDLVVAGNRCERGYDYAVKEVTDPERSITSSVRVEGGVLPLVSAKTDGTIPKDRILTLMKDVRAAKVKAPVKIGDVLIKDLGGTKVNVIATKNVDKK